MRPMVRVARSTRELDRRTGVYGVDNGRGNTGTG